MELKVGDKIVFNSERCKRNWVTNTPLSVFEADYKPGVIWTIVTIRPTFREGHIFVCDIRHGNNFWNGVYKSFIEKSFWILGKEKTI